MQEGYESARPDKLQQIKTWVKTHPRKSAAIGALVAIVIIGGAVALASLFAQPEPVKKVVTQAPEPKPEPIYYSPLTGLKVSSEAKAKRAVTAIMIENSPDARPQSGLKDAEVVYEAVAEGGITRFLALYQNKKPSLVGPVRSLREYYVDWLTPYNASVAHVGGSYRALQIVRGGGYRDIDQFFNPGAYWRAADRYAPHNVYTSFKNLDQLNRSKKYTTSKPIAMDRDTKAAPKKLNAKRITLNISGPLYDSSYTYSAKSKLYARSQAGAPHLDREKGQITAKVVVALLVNMRKVFEDGYRESITTTGKGTAYVFQNGVVTKVTWNKASRKSQLTFTKNGEPFSLERGNTWITAIPKSGGSVSWK